MYPSPSLKPHTSKNIFHTSSVSRILTRGRRIPTSSPELGSTCSRWQGTWFQTWNMIDCFIEYTLQEARKSGWIGHQIQTSGDFAGWYRGSQERMGEYNSLRGRRCFVDPFFFYYSIFYIVSNIVCTSAWIILTYTCLCMKINNLYWPMDAYNCLLTYWPTDL